MNKTQSNLELIPQTTKYSSQPPSAAITPTSMLDQQVEGYNAFGVPNQNMQLVGQGLLTQGQQA